MFCLFLAAVFPGGWLEPLSREKRNEWQQLGCSGCQAHSRATPIWDSDGAHAGCPDAQTSALPSQSPPDPHGWHMMVSRTVGDPTHETVLKILSSISAAFFKESRSP